MRITVEVGVVAFPLRSVSDVFRVQEGKLELIGIFHRLKDSLTSLLPLLMEPIDS